MNFAIEDTSEQSAFRGEVRSFLEQAVPADLELSVDPCDMTFEQYQLRREVGRRLGAKGWLYPSMPKEYGGTPSPRRAISSCKIATCSADNSPPPYSLGTDG